MTKVVTCLWCEGIMIPCQGIKYKPKTGRFTHILSKCEDCGRKQYTRASRYNTYKILTNGNFYQSKAWLELRFKFLAKSKRECVLCGSTGPLHVDHIKPRSLYPGDALDIDNLQVLCRSCNIGKSNKSCEKF